MKKMTKITLPGSIPGLLRRGSPVINTGSTLVEHLRRGIVVSDVVVDRGIEVAFEHDESLMGIQSLFALDLEDHTGRAHAIWWLGNQYGIGQNCLVFGLGKDTEINEYFYEIRSYHTPYGHNKIRFYTEHSQLPDSESCVRCQSIPGLTQDNCRHLNDAEALRRICLHVAGL